MMRGAPKSAPPWSLNPQGCLSLRDSLMSTVWPAPLILTEVCLKTRDRTASLDGHTSQHHCNLRTWYNCQQQRCSLFILICFVFPWIHHTQQFWIMFCCHQCKYAGGDLWIRHTPVFYSIKCVESRFNLTIPNSSFFKNNDTKLLPHHHPITLIIPSVDARPTALLTLPECAWLCRLSFLGRTCTTWTHLRLRQR